LCTASAAPIPGRLAPPAAKGHQDTDDGDDNQQFDQRESASNTRHNYDSSEQKEKVGRKPSDHAWVRRSPRILKNPAAARGKENSWAREIEALIIRRFSQTPGEPDVMRPEPTGPQQNQILGIRPAGAEPNRLPA
jgi:hypothetical protein